MTATATTASGTAAIAAVSGIAPMPAFSPVYVEAGGASLYFSSGPDIYVSRRLEDGSFGPAEAVADLNGAAGDIQPNIRKDGREIVFASDRAHASACGGQDLWVATRETVDDAWSAPVNLGAAVNTGATRPVPHSPGTRRPCTSAGRGAPRDRPTSSSPPAASCRQTSAEQPAYAPDNKRRRDRHLAGASPTRCRATSRVHQLFSPRGPAQSRFDSHVDAQHHCALAPLLFEKRREKSRQVNDRPDDDRGRPVLASRYPPIAPAAKTV